MGMKELNLEIKLSYVTGLRSIVLNEINKKKVFHVRREVGDSIYLDYVSNLDEVRELRSVARAYVVSQDTKYNPLYISNHKSILGCLIEAVIAGNEDEFKTFKITCAGSDSPEIRDISEYIKKTYKLIETEESDLKIHIIKIEDEWEVGIQSTPRPLSLRNYKVRHMSGAMDPTIAYALNSLCELERAESYLNIFSGSATLLIEAGLCYPKLKEIVGFDNNKKHLSLAIQNVKEAGLIQKARLKEADIFDKPDLGRFDAITSDLPFGMVVSKNEDLETLYRTFIEYCEEKLLPNGTLGVYTSEYEIIESILRKSRFKIFQSLQLKLPTNVGGYLRPKIIVCKLQTS
ncbi:MAG: hypothetical protein A2838_02225 [Candidatus Zambryskibacteria bacterium RIFCSPHIGHO2_01_FULL_46_25]|uniref:Ribosomal RNA large subunit methyltransferase K/L-like methyltransferase domain-containing protein n=1 Tax=Candidatus Zambryskibacteria bacterium RIFCSPHIGHO2_01_FULL_46_25 TaxID=1802738 RepID=A0A1G2SZV5_9BACT|nr:MAG: hypothetical protein A2838_02225 [Candidatus Zambryskibacteria bacterium RIFCSPHIGHO2_01_FULL_46_25]